ncbi:DUF86 domain-containing protein [Candidatus Binatia bacterium]|nr:DUF86 domain-containing protein [Candidatus Binatia bacterium]
MRREDRVRILDMIEEGEHATTFITGRGREDLDRDPILFRALVRAIEVMGEAASKVSTETRAATPEVPWRDIVSMRNRLIHGYSTIDPDTVWRTATDDIPAILPALKALAARDE